MFEGYQDTAQNNKSAIWALWKIHNLGSPFCVIKEKTQYFVQNIEMKSMTAVCWNM
jgi:hypothetical protein